MHDWTGVVRKSANDEGVVFTDEVTEDGRRGRPVTCEPSTNYRHARFAEEPVYVCECGDEFDRWPDARYHLEAVKAMCRHDDWDDAWGGFGTCRVCGADIEVGYASEA